MTDEEELSIDVSDPFARRLIFQYVMRRKADIDLLRSALADGRFSEIQVAGHNLSGSGGAYGLQRVSEIGTALEDAAKVRHTPQVTRLIDELDRYVHALRLT